MAKSLINVDWTRGVETIVPILGLPGCGKSKLAKILRLLFEGRATPLAAYTQLDSVIDWQKFTFTDESLIRTLAVFFKREVSRGREIMLLEDIPTSEVVAEALLGIEGVSIHGFRIDLDEAECERRFHQRYEILCADGQPHPRIHPTRFSKKRELFEKQIAGAIDFLSRHEQGSITTVRGSDPIKSQILLMLGMMDLEPDVLNHCVGCLKDLNHPATRVMLEAECSYLRN